jgi:hypothetical protein
VSFVAVHRFAVGFFSAKFPEELPLLALPYPLLDTRGPSICYPFSINFNLSTFNPVFLYPSEFALINNMAKHE